MHAALIEWFKEKLLKVSSNHVTQKLVKYVDYSKVLNNSLEINLSNEEWITADYHTFETYSMEEGI